jgi:hypothetical protein
MMRRIVVQIALKVVIVCSFAGLPPPIVSQRDA